MHGEQQLGIPGEHVEDVIEHGTGQRHANIDDGEENEQLQFAPQRLNEFAAHGHHGHVEQHLPQVRLEETERERRPQPERRREQVARRHTKHRRALRPEREEVTHRQHARYDFDAQPGVVEQQLGVLLDVWHVFTYLIENGHGGDEAREYGKRLELRYSQLYTPVSVVPVTDPCALPL